MYFRSADVLGFGEQMAFTISLLQRRHVGRRRRRRTFFEGKRLGVRNCVQRCGSFMRCRGVLL